MSDIRQIYLEEKEKLKEEAYFIIRGFFSGGHEYDYHADWDPYVPEGKTSFSDPLFPNIEIVDVNKAVRESITRFAKRMIVAVLSERGYKVTYQDDSRLIKFSKIRDSFYVFFSSHNEVYANEDAVFTLLKKEPTGFVHPVGKRVMLDAAFCQVGVFNFDNKLKRKTRIVLGSVVTDIRPSDLVQEQFSEFNGVYTFASFLKDYLVGEEKELLARFITIPSIFQKEVNRAIHSFHLDGLRVVKNRNIQRPTPVKLSELFEGVSFDELDKLIESYLNSYIERKSKPKWIVAYETAEWFWFKFHSIKHFDNTFIASEYFKAFDLFFSYFFENILVFSDKPTLGEKIMILKNNHNSISPNRIASNKKTRTKYFDLLHKYLFIRNQYIHESGIQDVNIIKNARNMTIDLMRMTIYAFYKLEEEKHEES